jgi:hypothetical protein
MEARSVLSDVIEAQEPYPKKRGEKKIDRLLKYINSTGNTNFTGYIKINFTQGNIGRIEKFEEILK